MKLEQRQPRHWLPATEANNWSSLLQRKCTKCENKSISTSSKKIKKTPNSFYNPPSSEIVTISQDMCKCTFIWQIWSREPYWETATK